MNCRHAITRLRSSQVAGRIPHGPSSSRFAPGTAATMGEWVATTTWDPAAARSCSRAARPSDGPSARVLLQVGVELAHRVGAQEVGPARLEASHHGQLGADARLALPDPERPRQGRTSLRIQPVRLGQALHDRRLPRPVLAHQHRQSRGKLEALPQQLRHGRDARGPHRLVDLQAPAGQEGPDRAGVELIADGHAPMMPRRQDISAER
jgi:hypothetical protein